MKKKLLLVFILAFALCAAWSSLTDTSKVNKSSAFTAREEAPWWHQYTDPYEQIIFPYLHFRQAMDGRTKNMPVYVSIGLIPKSMQHAIVATEDRRFYDHGAIDPIGIIRATVVNIYSGETVEGGSTISQQVVKNVFLSQKRTMTRKAQEVVLAFLLEHYYTKDEILEIYLNTAYFGANATGIDEASRIYFATTPEKLTLAQSSMLAGLVQAPSYYNPLENFEAARARQRIVLTLMSEQGYISQSDGASAFKEHLHLQNR